MLLAVALVGAGLFVCCLPITTEVLSRLTSGSENPGTPFSHEELVEAANAIRDYTVGSHSLDELYAMMANINSEELEERLSLNNPEPSIESDTIKQAITELGGEHIVDASAISHLDDVNGVLTQSSALLIFLGILLVICLIYTGIRSGIRWIGGVLMAGGILVIALFVWLGGWAIIDFNGFFAALHGVFFSQGNWSFPADSLMITALPTPFWIGMGIVWLTTTIVLSILVLFIGLRLRRRRPKTS